MTLKSLNFGQHWHVLSQWAIYSQPTVLLNTINVPDDSLTNVSCHGLTKVWYGGIRTLVLRNEATMGRLSMMPFVGLSVSSDVTMYILNALPFDE